MYKYKLTLIKTDESAEWYVRDTEVSNHIKTTYYDTGIMSSINVSDPSIPNTQAVEVTFIDINSYYMFRSDPIIEMYIQNRNIYEETHSIIRIKEEIN